MSIFNIDYTQKVVELAPPDKREVKHIAWLRSIMSPVQYLRDKFLGDYRVGSGYDQWVAGTYAKGDKVVFKEIVYESLIDSNTDSPPSANWQIYLPSFIGTDTRVKFNGQKIILEAALNQRFLSTFRQPPDTSDIYIETLPFSTVGFLVASTEPYSTEVGQTYSVDDIGYTYPFQNTINFTIHIPVAVYAQTNESEVRNFVDAIIPAGLNYNITTDC